MNGYHVAQKEKIIAIVPTEAQAREIAAHLSAGPGKATLVFEYMDIGGTVIPWTLERGTYYAGRNF